MTAIFSILVYAILFSVLYVYYSITLFFVARKTNAGPAWIAFFPGLNLLLLSNVAGFPAWTVLMVFVPYIGVIVAVVLAAGVAFQVGRPIWTAILQAVPVLNLFLPVYYASTKRRPAGQIKRPLPHVVNATIGALPYRMRTPAAFSYIAAFVSIGCIAYYSFPSKPVLKQRVGRAASFVRTYREFPHLDTEDKQILPYKVISYTWPQGATPPMDLLNELLPPGTNVGVVGTLGVTASGAQFFAKGKSFALVHVIDTGDDEAPHKLLNLYRKLGGQVKDLTRQKLPDSRLDGIEVAFPRANKLQYVLEKKESPFLIVISVIPQLAPFAETLLPLLGSQDGLMDIPEFRNRIEMIPFELADFTPKVEIEKLTFTLPQFGPFFQGPGIENELGLFTEGTDRVLMDFRAGNSIWQAQINGFGSELGGWLIWKSLGWWKDLITKGEFSDGSPFSKILKILIHIDPRIADIVPRVFPCNGGYVTLMGPRGPQSDALQEALAQ